MNKLFDIYEIGRYVRTITDVNASNSRLVDGPFKTYAAAAEQADHMNDSAASPRFIAVERR
jgi:hypothetical protein